MKNNPLDEIINEIREKNAKTQNEIVIGIVSLIFIILSIGIVWYNSNFWVALGMFLFVWGNNLANKVKKTE